MDYNDIINSLYNSSKKVEAQYIIFDIINTSLEVSYVKWNTRREWQTLLGVSPETWSKLIKRTKAEPTDDGRYKTSYPNIKRAYIENEAACFVKSCGELRRRQKAEINQILKDIYGISKEEQIRKVGNRRNYTTFPDNTIKGVEFGRVLADLLNKIKILSEGDMQAYLNMIKMRI